MNVFHLKYRPQKIEELDLKEVSSILEKILSEKEIPQSFLFAGPKGSGKTSAARIVARAVNCLKPNGIEPCGKCENCLEILNGSSIDIIEIDAASNRGIDDVRVLKEKSYLLPSKLKKKVFIIDEVHMLTKEAFNALLKLIEEPPKHVIFILCTTDPQKIPETVLSRLMRVDFKKGKKDELKGSLKKIIEGEKIEISDDSVDLIIRRSDGSFRNLQRIFNEIYLQFGKKIKIEDLEKFFGAKAGDYNEEQFENDLVCGDAKTILQKLENMAELGIDFTGFREKLLLYFQKKVLFFYGISEGGINISKMKVPELTRFINLLINASKQEKEVSIEQLPLELAVVEFLGSPKENDQKNKEGIDEIKIVEEIVEEKEEVFENLTKLDLANIEDEWGNVLSAVKFFNHSVEAFLRATRPKVIKGNVLVVEVFYPFHKERLQESKNRQIIEESLKKVFKIDLGFECILGKNKKEPLVIKNDTPIESVSDQLVDEEKKDKDIYDVAKEIFG